MLRMELVGQETLMVAAGAWEMRQVTAVGILEMKVSA